MTKKIFFKDVRVGDFFFLSEDEEVYDYKKISETEASILVTDLLGQYEVITDFSAEYSVGYYAPSYDSAPEFPNYYDAQGREHAEF